jgi:hypothetical protein
MTYEPIDDHARALRAVTDLAGTPVSDAGGRPIGALYGALVEADTGLLCYLDLSLDTQPRHVLVPIGHARVHGQDSEPAVRLRAAVLDDLLDVPLYDPDEPLDPPAEHEILAAHGRTFYGERYYAHPAYDHSGLYAGEDAILAGEAAAGEGLAPLSRMERLHVAAGNPDPRGWSFESMDGEPVGRVSDLLVDPAALAVRYLAIERDADDACVLLPVGFVTLEPRHQAVTAPGLTRADLESLPSWTGPRVEREDEERVRAALLARLLPERRGALPDFRRHAS